MTTSNPDRDPRLDPQMGDELYLFHGGSKKWVRTVTRLTETGVVYNTKARRITWMSLKRWRHSMTNARVSKVGGVDV